MIFETVQGHFMKFSYSSLTCLIGQKGLGVYHKNVERISQYVDRH